ncbi:hypothetical protein ABZZ79_33860 [Streptomyces sp. NPDC006458]|uniref:hypothetical protein n=1 Tax=Streptomyces sp. NPDC006458 TaxID=3154302 RepID=UPI0033B2EB94
MEKTWFEAVLRRRPHPVLRIVGNLAGAGLQVWAYVYAITQFHTAWRWLAVPLGLMALLHAGRGVAVAAQELSRHGAQPSRG